MSPLARALSLAVHAYRYTLSPIIGPVCRFEPTCSAYALDALREHGALRGSWFAVRRIARCHPWCAGGLDPVPVESPRLFTRLLSSSSEKKPS